MKRSMALFSVSAALLLLLLYGGPLAAEDVIVKHDGGKLRGTIVSEDKAGVTIKTLGGTFTVPRSHIAQVLRDGDLDTQFKQRWAKVDKYDPDAIYELGQWARTKKLEDRAKECFEAAIKLDSYHRKSREALGYRNWKGKWVTEDEYNQLARGLVKWKDKWVKESELDMYERGFEKDEDGRWLRPEDAIRKREWEDAERQRAKEEAEKKAAEKEGRVVAKPEAKDPKKPDRPEEDKSWYDDNTAVCAFAAAPDLESKYYNIKSNVKAEYVKRYGQMLDQYYVRFSKVFASFMPKGAIPRSPISVYASQQEFMSATGMGRYTGGFYSTGDRRVTAYHGRFGTNGDTRTVLAHEGTHQFEHIVLGSAAFGNAPIWIIEGLAVFFESAYYDGKKVQIALVPYDRLENLKRGAASNTLIPFHDLIRTAQAQFTGYHYAHAWGLIYFLLYGEKDKKIRQKRVKAFSDLLFLAKTRRVNPEDTESVFGGREGFQKFEEEWKRWIVELPYDFNPDSD